MDFSKFGRKLRAFCLTRMLLFINGSEIVHDWTDCLAFISIKDVCIALAYINFVRVNLNV